MKTGVVVIGRNEGERLKNCIHSIASAVALVYVDSGSTDGSVKWAHEQLVEVLELDTRLPFTAGRARNAGFRRLIELAPGLGCVQFVDGDCELSAGWLECGASFLHSHPRVGVVCGHLKERHPERSIYNWLCDREWDGPTGEIQSCGGILMARVEAFEALGGFREDMIAGEEPELCVRLRALGWLVWRLSNEMALHDVAMTRFSQWWRRAIRGGYAYAQGAYLHRASPEEYNVWESRRARLWGIWLPIACLLMGLTFPPWGWAVWMIYPLQVLRQTMRNSGSLKGRAILAIFQGLARFAEAWGGTKFLIDRLLGRQSQLIEYK